MTPSTDESLVEPSLALAAKLMLEGRTLQSAVELSRLAGSLPVIGSCLEPLGNAAAIAVWGSRLVPEIARALAQARREHATTTSNSTAESMVGELCAAALSGILVNVDDVEWPPVHRLFPLLRMADLQRRYRHRTAVRYGPDEAQVLDVWRHPDLSDPAAPVLVFVPGGGWVHGSRTMQGQALMAELAEAGWVCLAIDYRVSPRHRWPRHVRDVKAAVAWAHANVQEFGGDPGFVTIAGCSAGGHLASLVGLTRGDPDFDAELPPGADTSVEAVVSVYGRYDWLDRSTTERVGFVNFLENVVVQRRFERHDDLFRAASPISRLSADAPPFFVIHGASDVIIPVQQARDFVEAMRTTSRAPVAYLELPGAQHGFDMIDRKRAGVACTAIRLFLEEVRRRRPASTASAS